MMKLLSSRDYLRIQEAGEVLGVSEQTLRNWDRSGKLRAQRHPINGYRLYRAGDLRALLQKFDAVPSLHVDVDQLAFELEESAEVRVPQNGIRNLPPCHWSPAVALDPKHRPQRWDTPSTTVRRDWRKYPQEAHVLDKEAKAYRRLSVAEIAILQGFESRTVELDGLTNRQRIASVGDAVPPPLATAVLKAVDRVWNWKNRTAIEICAGIGGLAEGAASVGLEHEALIDISQVSGELLRHERPWGPDVVHIGDVRHFDYDSYRGRIGLLSGGPPCQPWSQSGHRRGHEDQRDLLGHLDAVVRAVAPEVFVFENVPGLATPANEPYLRHVVNSLRCPGNDLRYGVLAGILNAADFGVPQVRRRLFVLGFRDRPAAFAGRCFAEIERLATHGDPAEPRGARRPWVSVGDAISILPDPGGWRRWIGANA